MAAPPSLSEEDIALLAAQLEKISKGNVSPAPHYDDPEIALRTAAQLAASGLRLKQREREDEVPQGLRLNWELPVLPLIGLILTMSGAIWWYSDKSARQDAAIAEVRRIADAGTERGLRYVPKVDLLQESNKVQDERIQNLAVAIQELRKAGGEQTAILGDMRERLAAIMTRMDQQLPRRRAEGTAQ